MKLTPENLIICARTYLKTPWHHAGRVKGKNGGIDCSGLLICVMAELGIGIVDDVNYTDGDEYSRMLGHMDKYARRLNPDEILQSGDVLIFRGPRILNHCAFFSKESNTIIHSYRPLGCVEQIFDKRWLLVTTVRYRYRGLEKPHSS